MSRSRPDGGPLGFGRYLTDHVAVATHDGTSWSAVRIVPHGEPTADVVSGAVQYALSVFEGLKAYRAADGVVRMFRAEAHAKRFEASAGGLCLPPVPPSMFVDAISSLARVDADWCPPLERGALYVRPTIFASEAFLGVRPATTHTFVVVLSPVGAYFSGPERPLRLWAERERVRACPGGVGWIKTGGNYAASLFASQQARANGFDQVLWLDALRHELLEEAGTMNVFVRIGERVYTPPAGQTVLAGVTRDSCLTLLRKWGVDVEERAVSLRELADAPAADLEIWGTGTAAGVSRIGEVAWHGGSVRADDATIATRLREALTSIQSGAVPDEHGWLQPIDG